ncbi:MAG TPA: SDR family NAD(P)-dependent oxidoreductase [Opitutus sp.]|nr:SDR family NAD(P)-dependent oxidoreductase [Opitutus sp.]
MVAEPAIDLADCGGGIVSLRLGAFAGRDASAALTRGFQKVRGRTDAKVLMLIGDERGFLPGDIAATDGENGAALARLALECEIPVIAAMPGGSTGTGWLLACACDLMVCAEEAAHGRAQSGSAAAVANVQAFMRERFGRKLASEFSVAGRTFTGRELKERGVGCPVVPAREVETRALQLAREISAAPRESLRRLKECFVATLTATLAAPEEVTDPVRRLEADEAAMAETAWLELGAGTAPDPGAPETVEQIADVVTLEAYRNGVAVLTLRDTQSKNTFSEALSRAVVEGFARIGGTRDFKVVVVTGYENYFACGGTKEALLAIQEGKAHCTDAKITGLPLACEIPVIAAMQGHGIGAGWTLGMFCDRAFFSAESTYHGPYLRYGFTPGAGSTLIFPERLGRDLGCEVLLTATEYKGHELAARGVTQPVVRRAEVLAQALAFAHRLARAPRETLVRNKIARCGRLRARIEATYAREVALHEMTFVGRPEVRDKIERQFGQGAEAGGQPAAARDADHATRGAASDTAVLGALIQTLRETLATELHTQPEAIDVDTAFIEMGLDSINNVTWVRGLNQRYGLSLGAAEVYSHPTVRLFADHVLRQGRLRGLFAPETRTTIRPAAVPARLEPEAAPQPEPATAAAERATTRGASPVRTAVAQRDIAVVGMAGQFPQAKNVAEFWANLVAGRDCIARIPASRWSIDDYYDADPHAPGKTNCAWMGALEDVDKFDPLFFNLSPLEAEAMDPQQRLFLEACWTCFEDAGYDPAKLSGSRCGVFAGCGPGDYGLAVNASEMDAASMMGGSTAILSARISYLLNLQGPCMAVDTACSSALVAVAAACDSLILETSDVALAGGVGVMTGPNMHIMTSKAGMLSPDGRCFTFDQRANGFVPGEGVGVVLLKRLADAERDGDRIHGVIRGWGVNQDGKTNGITAPNGDSQARLEREVYERCGLNPEGIELLEAHGTGTKLGDPIEVEGLKASFRDFTRKENYCALGSVKSNIGHLLAASGAAGLIKALLALKHRQLPPTIHFEKLNEHIRLDGSPFYVNTTCREWPAPAGHPRRAAVSAFGFSGTNAHVVVEEYAEPAAADAGTAGPVIVVLSARDRERLKASADNLARHLAAAGDVPPARLREIAYTLQVGRTAMSERLGLVVASAAELRRRLEAFVAGQDAPGLHLGRVKRNADGATNAAADEAMRDVIEKWIAAGELEKLAEVWVGGFALDWNRLYGRARPRRTGLPTYPFARERYWRAAERRPAAAPAPAPLELPEGEFGLYQPVWQEAAADPAAAAPDYVSHLVMVLGAEPAQKRELAAALAPAACVDLESSERDPANRFLEVTLRVFEQVRALLEAKPKGKALVQVLVTSRDEESLARGILALVKTAREENPRIIGQVIEVEPGDAWPERLRENRATPDEAHVRYRDGRRQVVDWRELASQPETAALPWKDGGVYLITGGAGGIGMIFAREIATSSTRPTLVLTGRSPESPAIEAALGRLRALGANAVYRAVDVTDFPAVANLVDGIRREFGRLDGVLHAAGINRGNFIVRKPAAEFGEVVRVKVAGVGNLDRALGDAPLDFLVLFSSIAGVTGNAGQADYAAANAFMDSFASRRNARVAGGAGHGRTLAVNWPLWKEGGMGIEAATEALRRGHSGIVTLGTKDGMRAFYRAMTSGQPQIAVTLRKDPGLKRGPSAAERKSSPAGGDTTTAPRLAKGKDLAARTRDRLKHLLGATINLAAERIEADEPLESYGIDSILISRLNVKLDEIFPEVSKTLLFEVRTLGQLADSLVADFAPECLRWTQAEEDARDEPVTAPPALAAAAASGHREAIPGRGVREDDRREPPAARGARVQEPVAIIGIGGRYAQAETLDAFWENLKAGKNCVTEIPPERWALDDFYEPDPEEAIRRGRSYSKWGGFLDGFAEFDPLFFNINPVEALGMDPQERLFLQASWEVLEAAGYTRARLAETIDGDVGVFAGVTKTGFDQYRADWRRLGEVATPFTSFGSIANRVSYVLNLKGPSMPIDTMCSSSLTAIHEACEQLRRGRCRMAIAGGVNLYLHPSSYVGLCAARMLSRDGKCKSFGAGGNGFVPGEGVGVVLLKPLAEALRDGDPIHAIIRGTSVNHGGKTNGYTVPNPQAQRDVIRDAIERSGVAARAVSYIEAHGTGTELGDPIEVTGLTQAFAVDTPDTAFCALGSAKSNLGHLEAAAGIAGLTKVVLQLQHRQLAPTLHARTVNPIINFAKTPFVLQQELAEWKRPAVVVAGETREGPRIAGVSSFGAGGANAHVVIEEAPPIATGRPAIHGGPALVVLSAKTAERLAAYARKLADHLGTADAGGADLHDVAFTLQTGREPMEERVAFVAESTAQLRERLEAFSKNPADMGGGWRARVERRGGEFYGDEDLAGTVEAWLQKGKLERLAEFWVRGGAVDWTKLQRGRLPRRIVLPTYPFARERYWVDAKPEPAAGGGRLHPLVHANTSDVSGLKFSATFSGEEFFVADHRVNGVKMLPGVAYLEMVRFAFNQVAAAGKARVVIRNVVWVRPIAADDFGRAVQLRFIAAGDAGHSFSIETAVADGPALVRSQGWVAPGRESAVLIVDLARLRAEIAGRRIEGFECYAAFTAMGLEYGPRYQGIQEVFVGGGQTLARLALPAGLVSTAADYVLHPTLLDSALQSCGALGLADRGNANGPLPTFVPYAVDEVEIFGAGAPRVWAWARPSAEGAASKLDIDLCDEGGRVFVALRGISFRQLAGAAEKQEDDATLLLAPQWIPAPVATGVAVCEYVKRVVLLAGTGAPLADAIAAAWPGAACVDLRTEGDDAAEQLESAATHAFEIVRDLLRAPRGRMLVQVVVPHGGEDRLFGGLAGLFKTARQENPDFVGQVIDVALADSAAALAQKLAADSSCPADIQIRHGAGGREVMAWSELPDAGGEVPAPWKDGGVYLITGGAGGLGLIFADAIAREAKRATVILCGRSELNAAQAERLRALERADATVDYRRADVSRRADVESLIAGIRRDFGRLDGVIHGAGVVRDRLVVNKPADEFRTVLAPKVRGAVNLDLATRELALDFFVLFAAGAGVLGNAGQADYATANAFLDEFARHRNQLVAAGRRRGRTLAVDWPLWAEGGMTIDVTGIAAMRRKLGMTPLGAPAGVDALRRALATGRDQVVVLSGDRARLRSAFATKTGTPPAPVGKIGAVANTGGSDAALEEGAVGYFRELISTALRVPLQRIHPDGLMSDLGIDSVVVMNLTNRLEESFGSLSKTIFFEHQTVRALARYFVAKHAGRLARLLPPSTPDTNVDAPAVIGRSAAFQPTRSGLAIGRTHEGRSAGTLDIAIVGVSGRYPGARNVREFWDVLREGRDCVTEVPRERWDWREYYSEDPAEAKGHSSKWGGFIADVDKFDPQFFAISPKIAPYLDPQERLILEETWKALEDAGYRREDLARDGDDAWSPVGVYIGAMYGEYQLFGAEASLAGRRMGFAGNLASIANRVSYVLNLHGPSMMVDTMCSSSLTCVHLACQDLAAGRTSCAIAGGVNVTVHPNKYLMLSGGQFLSASGRCESFGEGGAGYIPSEGVGVVVLKRLADAERDGDHIYGVIKGSAVNHGGRTHGYSVPNPKAQERVIAQALREARVDPRAVSYVEAHGTGTKLGDPIEIAGLANAFGRKPGEMRCWLGSAKSNIGHAEAAAGVAGLTKVLLQLRHGQIAPSLHSRVLNPHIDFASTPFAVNQVLRDWERPEIDGRVAPRIAGISSFGAGGSNAHIVIEEYREPRGSVARTEVEARRPALVVLSAKTAEQLVEVARALRDHLASTNATLRDIAYTLQVGREAMEERAGCVAESVEQLVAKLADFVAGRGGAAGWVRGRSAEAADVAIEASAAPAIAAEPRSGDAAELLARWVRGGAVDWRRLHTDDRPRRVSLPTYPFARKRYWIERDEPGASTGPATVRMLPAEDGLATWNAAPVAKPSAVTLAPLTNAAAGSPMPAAKAEAEPVKRTIAEKAAPANTTVTAASTEMARHALQDELLASLAKALLLEKHEVSLDRPFLEMGLDSIVGVEWVNTINRNYALTIPASQVYEHPSLRRFTEFVHGLMAGGAAAPARAAGESVNTEPASPAVPEKETEPMERSPRTIEAARLEDAGDAVAHGRSGKTTDIAIVGLSGRFPGGATPEEFWSLLKSGRTAFSDLPADRGWDLAALDRDGVAGGKAIARTGAFLSDVDRFDPLFFQISPKEATMMDPGERIFLEECWKALEDAGVVPAAIAGRRWGVFCGNGGDYSLKIRDAVGYSPHVTLAQVPSRVSHCLNLTGPSQSVDAGCASALLAIAQACDHLALGKCEAALAGGVLIHSTPNLIVSASQVDLLASAGAGGRAFDRDAGGMVPGEAAGVVVLKPLTDALAAGDRIHAVIEGWGNNHNGATNGMTAPNIGAEAALFAEVYDRFGLEPDGISLVEANAAGLPLADAAEIEALTRVFGRGNARERACTLGSVENNVGHAFHASGMSHLMKVLLSLRHREIPPTPGVLEPNPALASGQSPFRLNTTSIPWEVKRGERRRAAVSSFGATGANVHLVLAEAPVPAGGPSGNAAENSGAVLVVLSAKTAAGLGRRCRDLEAWLRRERIDGGAMLRRVAANLLLRRSHLEHRCALVADDVATLCDQLLAVAGGTPPANGFTGRVETGSRLGPALTLLADAKRREFVDQPASRDEILPILADLFVQGVVPALAETFSSEEKAPLSLPAYPFERRRCWIDGPVVSPGAIQSGAAVQGAADERISTEREDVLETVRRFLSEITGLAQEEIDVNATLSACGVDSLLGMRLLNRVNTRFGGGFDASLLVSGTIAGVAEAIARGAGARSSAEAGKSTRSGNWVRPAFIETMTLAVGAEAADGDRASGERQLERLIAQGVGVWRQGSELCFEFLAETQTRASVEAMLDRPAALRAVLDEGKRHFPCSDMQRFALRDSEEFGRTTLNLCQGFRIDAPVDRAALHEAFNDLVRRHSIFRTGARRIGAQWMQVVADEIAVAVREAEWPEVGTSENFEAALVQFQRERNGERFAIGRMPLLDVWLVHDGKKRAAVFLGTHHFHADGFTLYLFQQELHERYRARIEGRGFAGSEAQAEYAHHALRQFDRAREESTRYWRGKLGGIERRARLREQAPRVERAGERCGSLELEVTPAQLARLEEFNRANGTTLTQLVTCAIAALLRRLTGADQPLQMVHNLRDRAEFEQVLGDFSSSAPLVLALEEASTWREAFAAYASAMAELQQHRHFDFAALLATDPATGTPVPWGDVALDSNDRDAFGGVTAFAGRLIDIALDDRRPVAPLLVCIVKTAGRLTMPLIHDWGRLAPETVALLGDNLQRVLAGMLENPAARVGAMEILPELQRRLARDDGDDA